MASHKATPSLIRPSNVLGLLLGVSIIGALIFASWQFQIGKPLVAQHVAEAATSSTQFGTATTTNPYALEKQQLVVVFAAWAAVIGWIVTSWTAIRNSVKQHTVNTLLQSRLSATYMDHGMKLNRAFERFQKDYPLATRKPTDDPTTGMTDDEFASLRYVLNYLEYVAIGIAHGDLHGPMLKSSLRSVLISTTYYSRFYLERKVVGSAGAEGNPALYCNLRHLYYVWRNDSDGDLLTQTMKADGVKARRCSCGRS